MSPAWDCESKNLNPLNVWHRLRLVAGAALAGLTYSDVTLAMLRHALTREQPDVPLPVVSVNDLVREPAVMPHGGSREGDS